MLRFDHPHMLWLALLALPLLVLGWRALSSMDRVRRAVSLALRASLITAIAVMLAAPRMVREHNHLTVIGLLDISGSVQRFADLPPISGSTIDEPARRSNIEYLRRWFRQATRTRAPEDRFGLIVFDGRAIAISAPTRSEYNDDNLDVALAEGTNIADAVRLGLAMFPADTAKRLVLVTDGNETAGSAREAISHLGGTVDALFTLHDLRFDDPAPPTPPTPVASIRSSPAQPAIANRPSSIPIDVLPIAYNVQGDVQVVRVEAPPGALASQTVTVRIVMQSTSPTTGTLALRREDEWVDLNGATPGFTRSIQVPQGQSIHLAQVTLGQTPINRFEAIFESDDPTADILPDNNRAQAFTATPSRGSVLVVDSSPFAGVGQGTSDAAGAGGGNAIAQILEAADLPVTVLPPELLPRDLLSMQNYDLVILDNVAASLVPLERQELLARYVNDLGGGLIMVGGDNSFGAGGWNSTPVEDVLPVEMDPSKEMRLPTAAIVFVLDKSGSMNQPVAGARASQQQVANEGAALAIRSLRSDSLVGVVAFDMFPKIVVPLQPNTDSQKIADDVLAIRAEGGTNMPPALARAYLMLRDAKAEKKRIVCLTDGRSHSNDYDEILAQLSAANIQLSTIAVGDDADELLLSQLAERAGGEFYAVRDPRRLPVVLVESVQVINKPLLKETPFTPQVLATGSTLTAGMDQSPLLNGVVITSPRDDPKVALEMITPDGEPLLAHWQAGMGRAAAFTSSQPRIGTWAAAWVNWPVATTFWTQLVRTIARPAMNTEAELLVTIDGDRLHVSYEITGGSITDPPVAPSNDGEANPAAPESPPSAPTDSRLLDYLQVTGALYAPDGTSTPVRLRQTAPGRYESIVDAPLAGNYIVALNPRQGARALAPAIGGASKSTSPEFRQYRSNIGLLNEIAEATGGRLLNIDQPQAVDLFDRTNMPRSESSLPVWRIMLFWTVALMLLDVACRRIAWDMPAVQRVLAAGLARVTPMRLRGRRTVETLSSLRRVSDELDQRQAAGAQGIAKLKGTGRIRPPPQRIIRADGTSTLAQQASSAPAQPSAEQVSGALDALLNRESTQPPMSSPDATSSNPQAVPKPAAPTSPPAEPNDGGASQSADSTTSSLLAAKRRARQRLEGDGRSSESP